MRRLEQLGGCHMSRPKRIPERGDVPASAVAARLGLPLDDFEMQQDALAARGFPPADPTTGCYCIEAVDRWRLQRHAPLFPELTAGQEAAHADTVFKERMTRLYG